MAEAPNGLAICAHSCSSTGRVRPRARRGGGARAHLERDRRLDAGDGKERRVHEALDRRERRRGRLEDARLRAGLPGLLDNPRRERERAARRGRRRGGLGGRRVRLVGRGHLERAATSLVARESESASEEKEREQATRRSERRTGEKWRPRSSASTVHKALSTIEERVNTHRSLQAPTNAGFTVVSRQGDPDEGKDEAARARPGGEQYEAKDKRRVRTR